MSFEATVIDGQVVADEPVPLPNGTRLEVTPIPKKPKTTLGQRLLALSGIVDDLPEDMAYQHDHYLYGIPKKP